MNYLTRARKANTSLRLRPHPLTVDLPMALVGALAWPCRRIACRDQQLLDHREINLLGPRVANAAFADTQAGQLRAVRFG
jgi:hypothetical protein